VLVCVGEWAIFLDEENFEDRAEIGRILDPFIQFAFEHIASGGGESEFYEESCSLVTSILDSKHSYLLIYQHDLVKCIQECLQQMNSSDCIHVEDHDCNSLSPLIKALADLLDEIVGMIGELVPSFNYHLDEALEAEPKLFETFQEGFSTLCQVATVCHAAHQEGICDGDEIFTVRYLFYGLCDLISPYPPLRQFLNIGEDVEKVQDLLIALITNSIVQGVNDEDNDDDDSDEEDDDSDDDDENDEDNDKKKKSKKSKYLGTFVDLWFLMGDFASLNHLNMKLQHNVEQEADLMTIVVCLSETISGVIRELKRIENDGIEEGEVTSFLVYFLFLHFFLF